MNELQVSEKNLTEIVDFEGMIKMAKVLIPEMIESTEKAMAAMSGIQEITSDEADIAANNLLVRVKETYKVVNEKRRRLTDPADEFKKTLMQIEGELDPTKGKDNGYNRIKQLREGYNQAKLDKKRKEEEALARKRIAATKIIDLKAAIKSRIELGPIEQIKKGDEYLTKWFRELTLEGFDEKAKQLNFKPNLKKSVYDSWFEVNMDLSGVEESEIEGAKLEVAKQFPYDEVNDKYKVDANASLQAWKDKLPEYKARLEAIAKAGEEEKIKLQEQLEAKAKIEQEERDKANEEKAKQAQMSIDAEVADQKVVESFKEQAGKQELESLSGSKKYTARFTDENWVKAFATVIYHCAINEKFPGVYAKNSDGSVKKDEKGREVYISAIEWFMNFFAKNCNVEVEGIKLYEDVKLQVRKPKES